jgi:hypothetical protein
MLPDASPESIRRHRRRGWLWVGLALAGITLVGLALRLYRLGELPFGFHPDEAHNLLDAVRIRDGWRPLYLTNNNGREALLSYLMAGTISLLGPSIWSVRFTTAVLGALIIPAQFLFVQALPLPRPRLTALASAALVAVTFWPVAQARYALRSNLVPVWVALILWAWWRLVVSFQQSDEGPTRWRGPNLGWIVVTGTFLAGVVHTHPNGRLVAFILGISALWLALRERRVWPLAALAGVGAVTFVLVLPLIYYFLSNPEMLNYRVNQVSVFNPAVNGGDLVGTLAGNAWKLILNPIVRGDSEWYYNLSGRPVFVGLDALFFVLGAGLLAIDLIGRRGRVAQNAAVLILAALLVMHASSWLSGETPNFSRMTGVWPTLFLLTAWGLERSAWWLSGVRRRGHPASDWRGAGLIAAALALSLFFSTSDYFGRYVHAAQVARIFQAPAVERASQVAHLVAEGPTYVTPALWGQSVIRAVNAPAPPRSFDPRAGLLRPDDQTQSGADLCYLFDPVESADADAFGRRWPAMQRQDFTGTHGELSLVAFRLPLAAWPTTVPVADASFGSAVRLRGYRIEPEPAMAGEAITLTLEWQAEAPTSVDMNFFVHLIDAGGRTVGQFDGPPLDGSYPSDTWLPNDRILQSVLIPVATDAVAGPATLRTGWYDWRTSQRLPVANDADAATEFATLDIVPPLP